MYLILEHSKLRETHFSESCVRSHLVPCIYWTCGSAANVTWLGVVLKTVCASAEALQTVEGALGKKAFPVLQIAA